MDSMPGLVALPTGLVPKRGGLTPGPIHWPLSAAALALVAAAQHT